MRFKKRRVRKIRLVDEPIKVIELGPRSQLRLAKGEHYSKKVQDYIEQVSFRVWYQDKDEVWKPTLRGVSMSPEIAREFFKEELLK